MRTVALLAVASVTLATAVLYGLTASPSLAQTRPIGNALPPPALHDPGTQALPASPSSVTSSPNPALPSMRDTGAPRDARGALPPEVTVRQRGDDTVQEYRRNGQVYMVVITPKTGIAQTYMVDPQGRVVDEHGQKPTRPVMYKVIEWGKSPPAPAASSATPDEAGG